MIDSEGRLFGRLNILDLLTVAVLAIAVLGFGLARAGRAGVHAKIKGEALAQVTCFIRSSVTDPTGLVKPGDRTFITLRNVPYSSVRVTAVKITPKMTAVAMPDGTIKSVPDPSDPLAKDILITIREKAHLTDDGIVFGDSKVKVGTPIDLEGFRYRLHGAIVDVRTVTATASAH